MSDLSNSYSYDTIVVGAGIAGLSAARKIAEGGLRVLVLEARARTGGRLMTARAQGSATPVELGAEFIHGRPPELLALLDEAVLALYDTEGDDLRASGGVLRSAEELEDAGAFDLMAELEAAAPDQSFDSFLAARKPPAGQARRARQFVEGFNAADATRIGTVGLARQQAAEDAIEGDRAARLVLGYSALAHHQCDRAQAAGAQILLDSPVAKILWRPGYAEVRVAGEMSYYAARVLVTVPLGVLQSAALQIVPEPAEMLAAAHSMAAGAVHRIVFQFQDPFWAERAPTMRFLFLEEDLGLPTWWTTAPHPSPLLVGWVGGPRAAAVSDPAALVAPGLRSLEATFGLSPRALDSRLAAWHTHDWQSDPYARGAYSYAPSGAADASQLLSLPVADTLYFAGEHTDTTGHLGTVHGALRSGLRAAEQILRSSSRSGRS